MRRNILAGAAVALASFGSAPSAVHAQPPFFKKMMEGTLQPYDFVKGVGDAAQGASAVGGGVAGFIGGGPVGAAEGAAAGWTAGQEIRDGAWAVGDAIKRPGAPVAPPQYVPPGYQRPVQYTPLRFQYREFNSSPASFVETGNGNWVNYANGYTYHFRQVARDNNHIILRDFSRNLNVMLNADGSKFWSAGGPWNGLGQGVGMWVR